MPLPTMARSSGVSNGPVGHQERHDRLRVSDGPVRGPCRWSGCGEGWLEEGHVAGVVGGLVELAFPEGQRAVEPGVAAVVSGEVEGRGDPPARVALTGAGCVAATIEPDLGTVVSSDSEDRCHPANGAAGLFEQGPFELAV